ncbi:hypothetical protein MPSEU_000264400 [Mayamaea pseudoterrestris]|nr:hypothetical protein MPSEU_000264400 [Mayamaea pseudoterrestris]
MNETLALVDKLILPEMPPSVAGYFVPSIAHEIHQQMQLYEEQETDDMIYIDLGGMTLGNGWVDARVQGPATIDFAYHHGMIDQTTRDNLHAIADHCLAHPHQRLPAPFHAFTTPDDCAIMEGVLMAAGKGVLPKFINGPNLYDVTTWDNYQVIQDGSTTINDFMNIPGVKKALNAPDREWAGCMPGAGRRRQLASTLLIHDRPLSTLPYIAELLDAGKRVLMYNGDRDLSTNAQGTETLLNSMDWNGADDWLETKRGLWVVDEYPAGYSKSLLGLDFVVIYNSGHLVPFNQPRNALDLFTRFLQNETFADYQLPSFDYGFKSSSTVVTDSRPRHDHKHHHHKARHDASFSSLDDDDRTNDIYTTEGFSVAALLVAASVSFLLGAFASRRLTFTTPYNPMPSANRTGYISVPDSEDKDRVLQ